MLTIAKPFNFVFVFHVKTPVIVKLFNRLTFSFTRLCNLIYVCFCRLSLTQLKMLVAYWLLVRNIGTCVLIVFSYFSN